MAWGNGSVSPRVIVPFAAAVAVSTETPLQALVAWGTSYRDLAFTLRNHDALLNAAFYVDTSESGVVVDSQPTQVIVPPLKEFKLTFRNVLSLYWALSASGDPDAAFASVNVSWQATGLLWYAGGQPYLKVVR